MLVTVHLHTILQRPSPEGPQRQFTLQVKPGTTVAGLMGELGITLPAEALLLVVNGRLASPETVLQAGDEVHFMPAISGGSPLVRRETPPQCFLPAMFFPLSQRAAKSTR